MKGASKRALPAHVGVRTLALLGAVLLLPMLYRFWFGETGWLAARALERQIATEERVSAVLDERNRLLTAEVMALKDGLSVVEARARTDLGMVAEGETFYVVVEDPGDAP